jgi:hypothetical protein
MGRTLLILMVLAPGFTRYALGRRYASTVRAEWNSERITLYGQLRDQKEHIRELGAIIRHNRKGSASRPSTLLTSRS